MAKRQAHKMINNFNELIHFVNAFIEIIHRKNKQVLRCSEYGYAHVTQLVFIFLCGLCGRLKW